MTTFLKRYPIRRLVLGIAVAGLVLVGAALYWGPRYAERVLNRQDYGALFAEATGGTFTSSRLRFHFFPVPHAVIPDGRIAIPGRMAGQWHTARIYPALADLFRGQLHIGAIVLERPDLSIRVPPAAVEDPSVPALSDTADALQQHLQEWAGHLARLPPDMTIEIRDGALRVLGPAESPFSLAGVHFKLQAAPEMLKIELRCSSSLWKALRLSGTLDPTVLQGRLQLVMNQFDPSVVSKAFPLEAIQWESSPMDIKATADLADRHHASATVRAQIPNLRLQGRPGQVQVEGIRIETALDYSPRGFRIDLVDMAVRQPSLTITGQGRFNPHGPLYEVELEGRQLDIAPLREAALALADQDEIVAGIFEVLQGGSVPRVRFSTRGRGLLEMADFDNMTITGHIEQGRLFIPEAELDLTEVYGHADISRGVLKGGDLRAALGRTTGSGGRLWLDFGHEQGFPFFVEIDVDADLAPLPSLLGQWVDDPAFKGEMRRIRKVSGTAAGTLVLDGRHTGLDVTVDATRCRLEAEYDRLPAPLSITEGMVQYTGDRIQVVEMSGRMGRTAIAALTAHVAFGDIPLVQVDTAAARIDMDLITPWLSGYGALDALPFSLESEQGQVILDRLALEGPLLTPAQWTVDTRGSLQGLRFVSPDLPGPAQIESARFQFSPAGLEIPEAHIVMADADLTIKKARFDFKNRSPAAATMILSGQAGPVTSNWVGDRIALGRPWRLKAPVTLTAAALTWSAGGEKSVRGEMTTGGGTHLSLDLKMEGNMLRHQTLVVDDQDSHAEMRVAFGPENLEIGFNGRISSATISRMMQAEQHHTGHMEGQFQARIQPKNPGSTTISGTLKAYDLYQPLNIPQAHHIKELFLEARDNRVQIAPAVIVVDDQTHRVTGSVDIEDSGYVLDLVHSATHLRLPLPDNTLSGAGPREPQVFSMLDLPLRGRIVSRLDIFTLGQLQWAPFNSTAHLEAGNWQLRIEEASLCGIATPGEIRISPQTLSIALRPATQDGSFDGTMTCLMEKPNLIDGRFDLTGRLGAQGPFNGVTRSISGRMELQATKGRIYRFNLLSKTLAVVNLTEIFRGKLPDLMENGLAYESIDIRVDIEDSVCTIREAVIDGASANIAGQGKIDLSTGETDMVVLVAPFKTVDALVRYTPVIGDWLGGTLISIPVRVTGAFSDPTVTPLSPSAVGSSLMNLMRRTVGLPVRIVEPLWDRDD